MIMLSTSLLLYLVGLVSGFTPHMEDVQHSESGGLREVWGFVEVRPGVHIFWWLYYTTHPDGYLNRPWIIWLQGGPGLSSTALGNFLEIGPLDKDQNPRNTTWVQEASVLFLDNPAGSGYSYVQNSSFIAGGIQAISTDMVTLLQVYLDNFQDFKSMPLFLFGQSYGGKFVTHLGYSLQQLKEAGKVEVNLQGICIGNGFVSPQDFVANYGEFLFQVGVFDDHLLEKYQELLDIYLDLINNEQWEGAQYAWYNILQQVYDNVYGMDFYNVLKYAKIGDNHNKKRHTAGKEWLGWRPFLSIYDEEMSPIMNGPVKDKLNLQFNIIWERNLGVYDAQTLDFQKDTLYAVDWLLQNSDVQINVYSGLLDFICETSGAVAWINRLTWSGLSQFQSAKRRFLLDPDSGQTEMFVKSHDTLKFYWILNSGHAVPADVPNPALRMLRRILNNEDH